MAPLLVRKAVVQCQSKSYMLTAVYYKHICTVWKYGLKTDNGSSI